MPFWHCPHCGTPQPETARCWVCRQSSTTCGTCLHYRRAVAGQLGYCGLARRPDPVPAEAIRPCWAGPASVSRSVHAPGGQADRPELRTVATGGGRAWQEVVPAVPASLESPAEVEPAPRLPKTDPPTTLWADPEG